MSTDLSFPVHLQRSHFRHALSDISNTVAPDEKIEVVGTTTLTESLTVTETVRVATSTQTSYSTTNLVSATTVVVLARTGVVRADRKFDGTHFGDLEMVEMGSSLQVQLRFPKFS